LCPCIWRPRVPIPHFPMSHTWCPQLPRLASPIPNSLQTRPDVPVPLSPSHFYTQPLAGYKIAFIQRITWGDSTAPCPQLLFTDLKLRQTNNISNSSLLSDFQVLPFKCQVCLMNKMTKVSQTLQINHPGIIYALRYSTIDNSNLDINHNCNKILKSDWLSTAVISALIGQFNRTACVMPK